MEMGNFSAAKGVGSGVYELRLDTGAGYRVYFSKEGDGSRRTSPKLMPCGLSTRSANRRNRWH